MSASPVLRPRPGVQRLSFVPEGDEVLVGRADTGSYGVFPPEGAELLRRVQEGESFDTAIAWYEKATGDPLDRADFLADLDELGFLRDTDSPLPEPAPVRWQRTGRVLLSHPALLLYAVLAGAAVVAAVLDPAVRPRYQNLFFTTAISLIPVVVSLGEMLGLVAHEAFHALAGRRLGLPSRLSVGRRLWFVVAETHLDALYSVPRRQRYLPFLAGLILDSVVVSSLTLAAEVARRLQLPPLLSGLALALAFSALLRLVWQLLFYLQTDLYYVIATAAGCTDLQGAARHRLRAGVRRLLRRPPGPAGDAWGEPDHRAARWYAPLLLLGYAVSLATATLVAVPTAVRFWSTVVERLDGSTPRTAVLLVDTLFFCLMALVQVALFAQVIGRELRQRATARRGRPRPSPAASVDPAPATPPVSPPVSPPVTERTAQ